MNLFDNLQSNAFDVVTNTMGYYAVWQQGGDYLAADFDSTDFFTSGTLKSAKILYKGPTEKQKLADANYDPDSLKLEYKLGNFDGLEAEVNANKRPVIRILDVAGLWLDVTVTSVQRLWDGKTFEARITMKAFGIM